MTMMIWYYIFSFIALSSLTGIFVASVRKKKIFNGRSEKVERRRAQRHEAEGTVRVFNDASHIFHQHAENVEGLLKDISTGGARISILYRLKKGQRVKLTISHPAKSINVFADVIWQQEPDESSEWETVQFLEAGVQFVTSRF